MFLTIVLGAAVIYSVRLAFFLVGQVRRPATPSASTTTPMVSVVVPARNEEANLARCLHALAASDYPSDRFEIIVVNDRSEDATERVLEDLARDLSMVRPLHRRDTLDHPNLKGKPGALQHGFDHATGEILVLTDADCAVHPQWLQTMVSPFADASVAMVNGFTLIEVHTAFHALQDVEWLYTQTMARAGIQNGVPLGCFGNNMAIRRSVYEAVGGYEAITFSITEDLALLQALTDRGHGVRYLCEPSATVITLPCPTVGDYLRQKHRWVRGGMALGMKAVAFVASGATYWIGLVASIATGSWAWVLAFVLLRVVGDGLLIATSIQRLGHHRRSLAVAPSVLVLLVLELLLPFMTLRKRVVWKNQIFRQ